MPQTRTVRNGRAGHPHRVAGVAERLATRHPTFFAMATMLAPVASHPATLTSAPFGTSADGRPVTCTTMTAVDVGMGGRRQAAIVLRRHALQPNRFGQHTLHHQRVHVNQAVLEQMEIFVTFVSSLSGTARLACGARTCCRGARVSRIKDLRDDQANQTAYLIQAIGFV